MNEQIERDRSIPQAVEILAIPAAEYHPQAVEQTFERIRERAKQADMFVLSLAHTISASGSFIYVTVVAQWATREQIEAMQRQQTILGGSPNGLRKV